MSTTASTHTHQTVSTHRTTSHRGITKVKAQGRTRGGKGDKGVQGVGVGVCACLPCVKSFQVASERAEKKKRERKGPKSWIERKVSDGFRVSVMKVLMG